MTKKELRDFLTYLKNKKLEEKDEGNRINKIMQSRHGMSELGHNL